MEKSFWGPSTWCMIHIIACSYQFNYVNSFKQFIQSLPFLLPCEYCRKHLQGNLQTLPLTETSLSNNKNLFMWTYFLHDLVNKQLKKKPSPAYPIAENYYFKGSLDPHFWGHCFWRAIHSFAATYRPEFRVKQAFKQFIYSLIGLIPCQVCKETYNKNLMQIPLTDNYFKDAHNLFLWTYLLHDLTNKQLGKVSPPFEDIKSQYFNDQVCSSCGS